MITNEGDNENDEDLSVSVSSASWIETLRFLWNASQIPLHVVYPMLLPISPDTYQFSIVRMLECMEEHFPVFDATYYRLRVASRTAGNIQESVPTPSNFRPESLLVGVIRHFRRDSLLLESLIDRLLALGIQPDGITSDGPSWISPLVAVEIHITDRSQRDRLQKKLMLHQANPNDMGWCGKTVLYYRLQQFCRNPTEENLADLVLWINLPQVSLDVPVFEWQPEPQSSALIDYLDHHYFRDDTLPEPRRSFLRETLSQVLFAFGMGHRAEDLPDLPTIGEVISGGSRYVFFQERIAIHWQLSWPQLPSSDWMHLMDIVGYWVLHPDEFEIFLERMWMPIEHNRAAAIEQEGRFFMDSIQFHPPQRFPFSWTMTVCQAPERAYQVWGGYLQVLFQHPVHPHTGEHISMRERERLWATYLDTNRLLLYWKDEMVIPDTIRGVIDAIRSYLETHNPEILDAGVASSPPPHWIREIPIHVFLTPVLTVQQTRAQRDGQAFRQMLDRICQWFRKIHPYSNFHQLLDTQKRLSIRFWKYLIQVLAHRPILSECIPLYAFEKWLEQHTDYRVPSTVLRLAVDGSEDALRHWSIEALQSVFIRCVYLCARENLDGFHYRFEEEWNIIQFFFKSVDTHGRIAMEHQADAYFHDLVDFLRAQNELYPYLTFGTLHKKLSILLRVFDRSTAPLRPRKSRNTPNTAPVSMPEDTPPPNPIPMPPPDEGSVLLSRSSFPPFLAVIESSLEDDDLFQQSLLNLTSILRPRHP